jgi:hypothetical protein
MGGRARTSTSSKSYEEEFARKDRIREQVGTPASAYEKIEFSDLNQQSNVAKAKFRTLGSI